MSKYVVFAYENSGRQTSHTREGVRDMETLVSLNIEATCKASAAFKAGILLGKRYPGLYVYDRVEFVSV